MAELQDYPQYGGYDGKGGTGGSGVPEEFTIDEHDTEPGEGLEGTWGPGGGVEQNSEEAETDGRAGGHDATYGSAVPANQVLDAEPKDEEDRPEAFKDYATAPEGERAEDNVPENAYVKALAEDGDKAEAIRGVPDRVEHPEKKPAGGTTKKAAKDLEKAGKRSDKELAKGEDKLKENRESEVEDAEVPEAQGEEPKPTENEQTEPTDGGNEPAPAPEAPDKPAEEQTV